MIMEISFIYGNKSDKVNNKLRFDGVLFRGCELKRFIGCQLFFHKFGQRKSKKNELK